MHRLFLLLSFLLVLPSVCRAQVSILVNKGSFPSIQQAAIGEEEVNSSDIDLTDLRACTESFAAMELAGFLFKAVKIRVEDIRLVDPKIVPKTGNVFVVGSRHSNSLIKKYDLPTDHELTTEQSYSIRSFRENDRVITIIEGADRIGTLYGVYRYLEELGIKFIGLGDKGTIFPDSLVDIPANLNIHENPSYLSRGFYTFGDRKVDIDGELPDCMDCVDGEFFLWMARNKLNYWTAENQPVHLLKKLGIKLIEGGHNVQGKIFASNDEYPYNHPIFKGDEHKPPDLYKISPEYPGDVNGDGKLTYFEAHPEWYGMKDGKRTEIISQARLGTNFCTSNEDARKEFARKITQSLIDGEWKYADIFNFWTFDGGATQWCTCDICKTDMSYTNRMFTVTHDILKEVETARNAGRLNRRVEIHNLAYSTTINPPTKPLPTDYDYENSSITFFPYHRCYAHSFADPACHEINQWQLEAYQGWTMGQGRYYKGSMFIGEYYNVSTFKSLPLIYTRIMAIDIPWYYRSGARHFNYMHAPHKLLGTWTLNHYLMGKLLWNVNANSNMIVDEYFKLYYPTTSYTSKKFYENLEIASANIKALKHAVRLESQRNYALIYHGRGSLATGENLFEIDHLHYDKYEPLINDGPDIVEMMDAMELAKKYLEQSLIDCENLLEQQRLIEDMNRFEYGYAMYRFIFHMIRTSLFHGKDDKAMAVKEFTIATKYAGQLKNMIDIVQVSSSHANAANGFEASDLVKVYENFSHLYGQ